MMKIAEVRKMDTAQLVKNIEQTRQEIAELRRSVHIGENTNVRMIRDKRKNLARMLTVMSEQLQKEKI
ncbi:MAG TPA: 50S ribosomal protein L29 [Candidatus Saccharimonadales bacterium]|nr:50S ribosomal protein L29 [Candidatus Saccharimonadales bacterium]